LFHHYRMRQEFFQTHPEMGQAWFQEIRNTPGYCSLKSIICNSNPEPVKRGVTYSILKRIKVVMRCIKPGL
ncbi:hypothetical protein, partial [Escherichia coli]|uniref:hypothetical protein n=2 Tax=Escherichia coli TaxID=562 RepID=UPI001BFC9F3D